MWRAVIYFIKILSMFTTNRQYSHWTKMFWETWTTKSYITIPLNPHYETLTLSLHFGTLVKIPQTVTHITVDNVNTAVQLSDDTLNAVLYDVTARLHDGTARLLLTYYHNLCSKPLHWRLTSDWSYGRVLNENYPRVVGLSQNTLRWDFLFSFCWENAVTLSNCYKTHVGN